MKALALQFAEQNNGGFPLHLILVVIGLCMFLFAAQPFWLITPADEPHRLRLVALGLFFVTLASFFR
jgi:hypothetical protein